MLAMGLASGGSDAPGSPDSLSCWLQSQLPLSADGRLSLQALLEAG